MSVAGKHGGGAESSASQPRQGYAGTFVTRRNQRAEQDAGMNSGALLLTGVPGVGKTTVLRRVKDRLAGKQLRGFLTDEIRSRRGERLGFRSEPGCNAGARRLLARRGHLIASRT